MAMQPYVIRQGDYLARLAHEIGFDADEVWNHESNRELRALRPNPQVLAPGDVLRVPDRPRTALSINAGGTHRYRGHVPRVGVRVVLQDGGRPLADEPYVVEGAGAPIEGRSDGQGLVRFEVPMHVREVLLPLPGRHVVLPVRVGYLDPVSDASGVRQRLRQLGYGGQLGHGGEAGGHEGDRRAIAAFQSAHDLPVTGEADDATRAALARTHGG
jgi:hypothetical protein